MSGGEAIPALEPVAAAALVRDGYLLLRGAVPAPLIEPLRAAFDAGELASDRWPVPRGPDWRHALVDLDPAVQQVCRLPALLAATAAILRQPFFLVAGRRPRADAGRRRANSCTGTAPIPALARIVSALVFLDPYGAANGGDARCWPARTPAPGLDLAPSVEHPGVEMLAGEAGDILVFDRQPAARRHPQRERRAAALAADRLRGPRPARRPGEHARDPQRAHGDRRSVRRLSRGAYCG